MSQNEQRTTRTEGVVPVLPEELDEFERQVGRFQRGEWDPAEFMAFRLKQGVYGQRQPDAQMFRIKIPFGGLTADQLDAVGDLVERYAPLKKGHVTTRQNIQVHHVKLSDTPAMMRLIGAVGLTTREACGNTVRNVTSCALAGVCPGEPFDVTPYAAAYARYFVRHPLTQALPRKFKTAFSGCAEDCAVSGIHDLGFLARVADGRKGFKVVTGGSTSIMPRLAHTLYEFVPVEEYIKVAEAVLRVFNRCDELRKNRMKARLKFFVDRVGIDEFRRLVEEELKGPWAQRSFDPSPLPFMEDEAALAPPLSDGYRAGDSPEFQTWLASNVREQRQPGYRAVTAKLPLGDIQAHQFHALADLSRRYAGGRARTTQQQDILFRWVPEAALFELWQGLKRIGLGDAGADEITDVVACPGTDSCKLGITASMGLGRAIIRTLGEMGITDPLVRQLHIKVSGCPNGCGQHHIADIGFHGAAIKGPGGQPVPAYELFFGGSYGEGDARLGVRVRTRVPAKRVPEALKRVLAFYQSARNQGEPFREFVARVGPAAFEPLLEEFKDVGELGRDTIHLYMDWDKTVLYKVERGEGECSI